MLNKSNPKTRRIREWILKKERSNSKVGPEKIKFTYSKLEKKKINKLLIEPKIYFRKDK